MATNWDRAAMRFASARYAHREGMLELKFENGDHFLLATESVLHGTNSTPFMHLDPRLTNRDVPMTGPDWAKIRIGETGDVLEVPALDTILEIPWDRIRSLADPSFRAHLSDRAVERSHRLGARLRALRLGANLTRGALATKVGVAREVVANLEEGKDEPSMDLLEQLASALGKRLRDFAEE